MLPKKLLNHKSHQADNGEHQHAAIRVLFGVVLLFALAGIIGTFASGGNSPIWGWLFFGIILVSIYASWLLRKPYAVGNDHGLVDAATANLAVAVAKPKPIIHLATTTVPSPESTVAIKHSESRSKVVHLAKYREPKGASRPLRLLLVDDNRVNLKIMQTLFEKSGYSVLVADGGLPAIDMLNKHEEEIDAAIIDLHMPDLAGDQVVMRWRLLEKRHMPICILTADGREESQQRCINAGADIFMAKPLSVVRMTGWLNSVATATGLIAPALEFRGAAGASRAEAD